MTHPGEPARLTSPTVTVGVFAYNHGDLAVQAAQSVVSSTLKDWELVVVDDASTDDTLKRLRAWADGVDDPRVTLLYDGENHGLATRLNEVAARARGEWLAVLGGDDRWLATGLATLLAAVAPGVDVVWGDLEVVDRDGRPRGYARPRDTWQGPAARRYITPGTPGADILRWNNFISGTSPLVRISALRTVGGYTPGVRNEDLDLWLRLGDSHHFRYVDSVVAQYRVVPGSASRSENAATLDQAHLVRRLQQSHSYPRSALARLLVMRWLLAAARTKGRPPITLRELAEVSGVPCSLLLRQIVRAGADPLLGSFTAWWRRVLRVHRSHARPARR